MASTTQMITAVRRMAGSPDTTEVPDATIQSILEDEGLPWLNRRKPGVGQGSFTTVADQQDYDEKPSNAFVVTEVFWLQEDAEFFSPSMRYRPDDRDVGFRMAGFSSFDDPALVVAFNKNLETFRSHFSGTGKETPEGQIRLIPTPGTNGETVYYYYTYPRWSALANVPDRYVQGLEYKAAQLLLESLAIRRGRIRGGRNFTGGGGEREDQAAEKYKKKANALVPQAGAVFGWG